MKTSTHIKNASQITTHFPKLFNRFQWLNPRSRLRRKSFNPERVPSPALSSFTSRPPPAPPDRDPPPGGRTAAQPHTRSVLTGPGFRVGTSACSPRPISDLQSALVGPSWASSAIAEQGTHTRPDPPPRLRWDRTTSRLLRPAHTQTGVLLVVY